MGRRGPVPQPTSLKKLLGNPGKRPLNEHEPIPPEGPLTAPATLEDAARPYWNELIPLLAAMKVGTVVDAFLLERYCNARARYVVLNKFMMRKGVAGTTYSVRNEKGDVKLVREIPQAKEYRLLQGQILQMERELGLTPAARSRLRVEIGGGAAPATPATPSRDDELAHFFAANGPSAPKPPRVAGA